MEKLIVVLVCEDPTFGLRGSRKYWRAVFVKEHPGTVETDWGRIEPGRQIHIDRLSGQSKPVTFLTAEKALAFIGKKVVEKRAKGYRVVRHIVDDMDLAILESNGASPEGFITMSTRSGR